MTVGEVDPPEWLNSGYLEKALREARKEPSLEVKYCLINPATAAGDHYASQMFRATLKVAKNKTGTEDLSLICKILPLGDAKVLLADIFDVEAKMLKEILPIINKSLERVVPNFRPLNATCIHHALDPECVIIMQDLKESGFTLADRMNGLDMKTSSMVLRAIAQLHAGSLLIHQNTPKLLESFKYNFWGDGEKVFIRNMLDSSLASLIEAASAWADFPAEHLKRLEDLQGNIFDRMIESVTYSSTALGVLQHGDCWINNMMFKGNPSNYTDFRFVDYQISHFNSAGVDLNYFIFTSPTADIRVNKIEEMLKVYYDTFMDVTEKIGADVPSWFSFDELRRDFRNHAFFGFIATILVYPITITEKKDVLDVNEFFDVNTSKKSQYTTKKFKEVFKMVLPYFIDCGAI